MHLIPFGVYAFSPSTQGFVSMVHVSCVGLPSGFYAFSNVMHFLPLVSLRPYAFSPFRPLLNLHRDFGLWSKFPVLDCL